MQWSGLTLIMSRPFFPIGHSNHSIDEFIALLKPHGVTVLNVELSTKPIGHQPG